MLKAGLWLPFVVVFSLMIGGIQTLGWWTRTAPLPQVSHANHDSPVAPGQAIHWRALVMR